MLVTILDIGAGLFTGLAIVNARPSAEVDDVFAAAVMLLFAGAAQIVAAGISWADDANVQLFVSAVWAPLALAAGCIAWTRAARMDKAAGADTEGDLW
jgi:hypothetical protein